MSSKNYNFNADVSKVLNIMINSLYTNKDVFLRELISNASDACEKLRYNAITNPDLISNDESDLRIDVEIKREAGQIVIRDNGIGMSREELKQNLGTIAKSGTGDMISELASSENASKINDMIGQFGVGFYSSFMVADSVSVESKKAGDSEEGVNIWTSNGEGSYSIKDAKDSELKRGTIITLTLKADQKEKYLDKFHIKNIIESYSNHIGVKVYLKHEDQLDPTEVNKKSAIWAMDKKDLKDDDYNEFFKSISHLPTEPWAVLHNKIEGNVNYTNLLFIPSSKPFDLFHPDRQTKVKLYVKKVFITEEGLEIIPRYLRFLYGVIDSPDLPLNISRQTLQNDYLIGKIRDLVTKKVISELTTKKNNNYEEYSKFWENFGSVLKEGLCEVTSDRDALMNLMLFKTTKSDNKLISLNEYIERMKSGQSDIYYIISESQDVSKNPQIEGFISSDIEVIILPDHVDNFWTTVVFDYKEYQLKSVNRSDIDLSGFKNDEKSDENKHTSDENERNNIVNLFKEALSNKVKDVIISKKLHNHPASLAVNNGSMDITMEKFMVAQGQMKSASLKLLEINPDNKLVQKTYSLMQNPDTKENGKDVAVTIFEIACIAQGEHLANSSETSARLFKLLSEN